MSFASGFFGTLANNMSDKRQFIRNRIEEDRTYLREQGLRRMSQVQEQRQAYQNAVSDLVTRGADESLVTTALEANPRGLLSAYETIMREDVYDPNRINSAFRIADEYRTEASLEEVISRILPVTAQLPEGTDPGTVERQSLAAFLGLDTESALAENVYGAQIVGGMTGDQILASMNLPVSAQGTDDTRVAFDFQELARQPMTASEAYDWQQRAYEEYAMEAQRELESLSQEIDNLRQADDPASRDILSSLVERKRLLEDTSGTLQQKISRMASVLGPLPNTAGFYQSYPDIFSDQFGFDATFRSIFEGQVEGEEPGVVPSEAPEQTSLTQEEAEAEAERRFEEDRDLPQVTLNVDGQEVTIVNPYLSSSEEEETYPVTPWGRIYKYVSGVLGDEMVTEAPSLGSPPEPSSMDLPDLGVPREDPAVNLEDRDYQIIPDRDSESWPTIPRGEEFKDQKGRRRFLEEYLLMNPSLYLPEVLDDIFIDLGIDADTPFGHNLANMISRGPLEERQASIIYLIEEYKRREMYPE